jgi:hypothetical protein
MTTYGNEMEGGRAHEAIEAVQTNQKPQPFGLRLGSHSLKVLALAQGQDASLEAIVGPLTSRGRRALSCSTDLPRRFS